MEAVIEYWSPESKGEQGASQPPRENILRLMFRLLPKEDPVNAQEMAGSTLITNMKGPLVLCDRRDTPPSLKCMG